MIQNEVETTTLETKETFFARLTFLNDSDRELVDRAYTYAKNAMRGQERRYGGRTFDHARGVAIILIDEVDTRDATTIAGALLHDTGEDTSIWGSMTQVPWNEFVATLIKRINDAHQSTLLGQIVANLTKAPVSAFATKQDMMDDYLKRMMSTPRSTLIKQADRVHNLRSLLHTDKTNIKKQLVETIHVLLPLFENCPDTGDQHALNQLLRKETERLSRLVSC